jgi:membrane-bound lytic murein transglycosylase B
VPGALAPVVAGEAPVAALDPVALSDQILQSEMAVRNAGTPPEVLDAAGRLEQVAYRRLGEHPEWEQEVFARTPPELHEAIWRQATARREFVAMHTRLGQNLPAWRIVDPLPADQLLAAYQEAQQRFGVPWNVLAAVNLVETGMGRIVGLSSAGAQGPMQFMPATWSAYGMGGDVWDTHDAILGAANYLAANGGGDGTPEGLANALFHYNRSQHYVNGVLHYAAVMAAEPRTFLGMHAWPVVYATVLGDITLPTGYEQQEPIAAADWLARNP